MEELRLHKCKTVVVFFCCCVFLGCKTPQLYSAQMYYQAQSNQIIGKMKYILNLI